MKLPNLRWVLLAITIVALIPVLASISSPSQVGIKFYKSPQPGVLYSSQAYISGAITNPGVYNLNPDIRIGGIIEQAGGLLLEVDKNILSTSINLSERVKDEQHIFIPFKEMERSGRSEEIDPEDLKVSINTASLELLITLPGVGTSTGNKIIQSRPFKSLTDLKNISGIGDSKYLTISSLIRL